MSEEMMLASEVRFGYGGGVLVLDGVGLKVRRGEILGILGPNGSGKTTFIKCLNRILKPFQGEILLQGEDLADYSRKEIATKVGFVPQSSDSGVSSPMVFDVVMMGRRPHMTWQSSKEDEDAVWAVMEDLDVAHLATRHFNELSSGQAQRVLIARAIAQDADVLLLDEPTSNLDVKFQMEVMNLIKRIVEEKNVCSCAIVHDLDLAMKYCDKVVLLNDGKIRSAGTPLEALTHETIREVYGVHAYIEEIHGRYRVLVE